MYRTSNKPNVLEKKVDIRIRYPIVMAPIRVMLIVGLPVYLLFRLFFWSQIPFFTLMLVDGITRVINYIFDKDYDLIPDDIFGPPKYWASKGLISYNRADWSPAIYMWKFNINGFKKWFRLFEPELDTGSSHETEGNSTEEYESALDYSA